MANRTLLPTAFVLLAACSWPDRAALAQDVPVPPCAGMPYPAAGDIGASLNQLVWMDDDSLGHWSPPACTGWDAGPASALLAGAGRFRMAGDTDVLAGRLARVSDLTDMVYWSSTRSKWRNLFDEAAALSRPEKDSRRADFDVGDIVPDNELYFWLQEDNPTAGVVYRLLIHERDADRIVFETVNVTPVKARILFFRPEIAAAGEFRQLYFIEREKDASWRYYSLVRMGRASSLAGTSAANYRNRAEAYFRYLAGLRMDREPPAAP